ncbi:uncharacterized protein RJT21DRAFT_26054 [Scheffersomyces amazonensis]|uniref:uncharacterized protein n=1 Tax=Scheffersomyces amazonensis TaxID=1078765 RepID=UPI00315DA887
MLLARTLLKAHKGKYLVLVSKRLSSNGTKKFPNSDKSKSDNNKINENNDNDNDNNDPNNNSALVERFTQILEQKIASDSFTNNKSMMDSDPKLKELYQKYSYEKDTPSISIAKSYIKSEPLLKLNKHARDIYESVPWKGTENTHDANLRMIVDSKPRAKSLPQKGNQNRIMTPPVSFKDKVINAKESSMDYKLKKEQEKNGIPESDNFRELYKERLLGPSMLINTNSPSTTIDLVNNLASNKINAAINQATGQFDSPEMIHVRGKPLDIQHLKNCTDSNYFMNQVLNKQEVLPPWIESQQTINNSIKQFREQIDELWFKWIINKSPIASTIDRSINLETIINAFNFKLPELIFNRTNLTSSDLNFLNEKLRLINVSIRNYNLQSPSSHLHKFKLIESQELKDSYKRSLKKFPENIQIWFDRNKGPQSITMIKKKSSSIGLLNLFGEDSTYGTSSSLISTPLLVNKSNVDNKLHIWKAIKDIFK